MFTTALRWHVYYGAFKQLEQALLHTFAGYVACDRRVVAFAGYFVNFVNEDYAALCFVYIVVGSLQQSGEQAFYIFAYITAWVSTVASTIVKGTSS